MNFVLVRPYDDKDIVELIAVQHPKKPFARFQEHWDETLNAVKKSNPTEWGVDEVFGLMEDHGWTIMKLDPLTVEY
jgi:hypothetical protein